MEEQMTLMNEFDTERAMLIEQHMQEMNDLQVMNFCLLCVELYIFFKRDLLICVCHIVMLYVENDVRVPYNLLFSFVGYNVCDGTKL